MALCRNWSCGCEAGGAESCPLLCEMCQDFAPICPVCCAVYGEHRLDCTVPDYFNDCGEGPFTTEDEATTFAQAEVGVLWFVVKVNGKWYVTTKEDRD